MQFRTIIKWLSLALIIGFYTGASFAQEERIDEQFALALEMGNWLPHSLNDDPQFTSFGAAGATPYWGISLLAPIGKGIGLKLTLGYWSLKDIGKVETVHSLVLHPVSLDVKYWLVPDYRLSAYVLYGGGIYWGIENETSPFGDKLRKARAGFGANLGAGFDLRVIKYVGVGMTFQYHLVRFDEPLGGVDDYSGPKVTGMIMFYL
jgi:hypothetical protein